MQAAARGRPDAAGRGTGWRRSWRPSSTPDRRVYGARVLVLVGSGNNGGDALFAGARLARRGVRVAALSWPRRRRTPTGLAALLAAGGRPRRRRRPRGRSRRRTTSSLDGILGIGGRAGLRGRRGRASWTGCGGAGVPIVAVDLPSRGGRATPARSRARRSAPTGR